ncbi:GGDEF domain-containing protein [Mesorhizobium sp. Z1-4]|uniref:GGDEF domain-containing protein n=1 Tax=Mesorhizobium sp. Z1-4 TaxID=2448478 RepID=UPI000FDC8CBB|nr:GGDEF domain-containing protein [Mesorhizobium sp. Z1-4]
MRRVLRKSIIATLGSIVASVTIGAVLLPALGATFGPVALAMCVICPLLIATPVTLWSNLSSKRLTDAHEELRKAHERLAGAHAELAVAHSKLSEAARHDDLTGMLNREGFFSALEQRRAKADSGTLMIIDADFFKRINDTYGHLTGDEALKAIAGAICGALEENDLRGRIGGEEFAVFLKGTTPARSMDVAQRIRRAVQNIRFDPGNGSLVPLTVSLGAASHVPGMKLSDLMREADGRLYAAKRGGRNRVVFEPDLAKAA